MKHYISLLTLIVIASLSTSCTHSNRQNVDISHIDLTVKIQRFDSAFWAIDTNDIASGMARLANDYPGITDVYLRKVVTFGAPDDELTHHTYRLFRRDTAVTRLYTDCLTKYTDLSDIDRTLTDAFRRAKALLPQLSTPRLYCHVSGFNQSLVVGDGFLSVSLDNYLGTDYPIYQMIGIYDYQRANMRREKITPDYIVAWLSSEYYPNPHSTLLDDMLYHGKILYATSILLPDVDYRTIMGYSDSQWQWVKEREYEIWQTMLGTRAIYETNILTKGQYLNDGPFTLPLTQESPARIGTYTGWQIVDSFMKKNPSISLAQLMELTDYQSILSRSKYNPKK